MQFSFFVAKKVLGVQGKVCFMKEFGVWKTTLWYVVGLHIVLVTQHTHNNKLIFWKIFTSIWDDLWEDPGSKSFFFQVSTNLLWATILKQRCNSFIPNGYLYNICTTCLTTGNQSFGGCFIALAEHYLQAKSLQHAVFFNNRHFPCRLLQNYYACSPKMTMHMPPS